MKVLDLRKGEWHALDDKTLEDLTVRSEQAGNFSMRLLAGEVYRLRAENARLGVLTLHYHRVIEQIAKTLGHVVEHPKSFGPEQLRRLIQGIYDATKKATAS